MRAAVLREPRLPLALEEIERPRAGPGEVVIEVEACGVCHSDLHLADGDWPALQRALKRPLVLGHEVVGRVVETGSGVSHPAVGARVGVPWLHWTCGACEFCAEGRENLCLKQKITGATVDGGFAEFIRAAASHAPELPHTLDPAEAAPLFCAGVTVYRGLRNAGVVAGQRVAVFGVGGLGHLALQIARALGAEVIAADVDDGKLALAVELGATRTLRADGADLRAAFRAMGGVHVALVTSAAKAAYTAAFGALRRGGTLGLIGAPDEDIPVSPMAMIGGEYRIVASAVGTRTDLDEVLALAAGGKVRCRVERHPLHAVNDVFAAMRRGAIVGRAVLSP